MKRLFLILFVLIAYLPLTYARTGFYVGVQTVDAEIRYDDIQFLNENITGLESGNDDQKSKTHAFVVGKNFNFIPIRIELEQSDYKPVTFKSYWNPFAAPSNRYEQRIIVDSNYTMLNVLYDYKIGWFTLFAGAGVGNATNKTKAEQQGISPSLSSISFFRENTNKNTATAFNFGVSVAVSLIEVELSYKSLNLGKADSSIEDFYGHTEQFKGNLKSNQVSLGLRANF